MSSKRQKRRGYPLPAIIRPDGQLHFCVTIPDDPAYYNAFYVQLRELGKWWMWKRDAVTETQATESAMMWRETLSISENCGGGFPVTPEEFYDANKRSIYDAYNDLAKQLISGRTTNIAVGDDGTVSDPTAGGTIDLPADDPTTVIDEAAASLYGAMSEIAYHVEQVFDKIDTLYGATNGTPVTTEADAFNTMITYFQCDENLMSTAVSAYYAFRAGNPRILFDGGTGFPQYLYCNGYDVNTINKFMLDVSGYSITRQNINNKFLIALLPEFFSKYYSQGAAKENTGYIDASCYPFPTQEYNDVPFASARTIVGVKANHRAKFRFAGHYTDPDGDLQDAFWYRTAAGVLTRTNPTVTFGAGSNMPSDAVVVYRTDHVYEYTIDLPNLSGTMTITMNKNAGMAAGSTSPTNGFDIKVTDVGASVNA